MNLRVVRGRFYAGHIYVKLYVKMCSLFGHQNRFSNSHIKIDAELKLKVRKTRARLLFVNEAQSNQRQAGSERIMYRYRIMILIDNRIQFIFCIEFFCCLQSERVLVISLYDQRYKLVCSKKE